MVQGDVPGPGNDILWDTDQLTRNHVDATVALADDVAASGCVIAQKPDVIAQIKDMQAKIISGEIAIPDPMAQ